MSSYALEVHVAHRDGAGHAGSANRGATSKQHFRNAPAFSMAPKNPGPEAHLCCQACSKRLPALPNILLCPCNSHAKVWRQALWLKLFGHTNLKRTLLWSTVRGVPKFSLGNNKKKVHKSERPTTRQYVDKRGKKRYQGSEHLRATQILGFSCSACDVPPRASSLTTIIEYHEIYCILFYSILFGSILFYYYFLKKNYIISYSIILYHITLYYIILHDMISYYTILYYTILYYTILHYTILY